METIRCHECNTEFSVTVDWHRAEDGDGRRSYVDVPHFTGTCPACDADYDDVELYESDIA